MARRTVKASLGAMTLTAALGAPVCASATVALPTGLAPGSAYRLVYVTAGTIDASSGDIGTYNSFVASEAAAGTGLPATAWHAIASTSLVSALANIACTTGDCSADPIYLTDGTEIATSTANLFSGSILNPIDADQSGQSRQSFYVWTGSRTDGSAVSGAELGSAEPFFGTTMSPDGSWISEDQFFSFVAAPLYAISDELLVPGATPVPEPATLALLATGLAAASMARRRNRG